MPTNLETEHRGYTIRFNEQDESWCCRDLGITNAKLAAVKRRIDELSKGERTVNVPALFASHDYATERVKIERVIVTTLCEPEKDYNHNGSMRTKSAWVKSGKSTRTKVDLSRVYPLSAEAELRAWATQEREASKAAELARQTLENIRTHDADSLMLEAAEQRAAQS